MPGEEGKTQQDRLDLTSDKARAAAASKASKEKAKEAPDQRAEAMKSLQKSAKQEIAGAHGRLIAEGKSLDANTQKYLENYFRGSIDRFDKDMDGKINAEEAKEFNQKMLAKTKEIIGQVSGAAEKHEAMSKAAANVEKIDMKSAEKSIESIKDVGDISDLEGANKELTQLQQQNTAYQQSIQNQLSQIQKFGAEFQKFQTAEEGIGGNMAGIWNSVFNGSERDAKTQAMQKKLEDTKAAANAILNNLTAKKKTLDANGEKIKAAIAKARADAIKERDDTVKSVEEAAKEQQDKLKDREKQYKELQEAKEKMLERQKAIQGRQAKVAELRGKWNTTKSGADLDVQEKEYKEGGKDIDAEIHGYRLILGNPNVSAEYKAKVKIELEKAEDRKGKSELGLKVIGLKRKSGAEYEEQLDEKGQAAATELQTVDGHLKRQEETAVGLSNNIATLEQLQLETATKGEEVTEIYNKKITAIDKHSETVSSFVLDASMGRSQSLSALSEATKSLDSVTVKSKGFLELVNPLNIVGNLSKDIGGGFAAISHWIDGNVRDVLEMTREGGVAENGFVHGVTQFLSVFSGFVSGASELVGGIFTLAGNLTMDIGSIPDALLSWDSSKFHAFDTLKGLGSIIGYDAAKGEFSFEKFGETWATMGKSLIGYGTNWGYTKDANGKEVWRDEYGTGLGKGVFNVLSMFVGVGAAKAAQGAALSAKVGSATGKAAIAGEAARIAAIEAAKATGKAVGRFTGRGAQTLAFSKAFIKNIKPPKILREAAAEARLAEGIGGKTWAVTKTMAGGAGRGIQRGYEAGVKLFQKKAMEVNGQVVRRTPVGHALRQVPRVAAKVTAEVAMFPYKLAWKGIKELRNTGQAFSNVSRGVFNREAVMAAESGAKMGRAARVMEQYGDDYAKAQSRIEEIIQGDPALSERAAKIETMGANKTVARQTLESEVVQQMVRKEPELANAYTKVRRAAQELNEEAATYARVTRENIEKITNNPAIKADYVRYKTLQRDLRRADKGGTATQVKSLRKKIKEMEADPIRMANVQQYEGAISARNGLRQNTQQLETLHENLLGSQSTDAAKLAEEIVEARRSLAPADTAMADLSVTREAGFMNDFVKKYDNALEAGDDIARAELESTLGTVHPGSPLEQALKGLHIRRAKNIPAEPAVSNGFKLNQRKQLQEALEEGLRTDDYARYEALKHETRGAAREYVTWMEERYKTLTQSEARSVILSDSTSFGEALRVNQEISLQKFAEFEQKILDGATEQSLVADMRAANLSPSWQKALKQIRQRNSFRNMHAELTGNVALSRIRSEYAKVINPEMNAVEAADTLYRRYRNDSMGKTASSASSGRNIAHEVRLADGKYSMRVLDDGTVRLFNTSGEMIMTNAEARAVQTRMAITSEMTAREVADAIAERYKQQGSQAGAGEARVVTKELLLEDGQYTLKLTPEGELQLFTEQGALVRHTNAPIRTPASAPATAGAAPSPPLTTPAGAPAAAPARARSSAMRRFDGDEALVREVIENDPALKTLYETTGDDLAQQIARGKAEVKLFEESLQGTATQRKLTQLESDVQAATAAGDDAAKQLAQQALDEFMARPAYQKYSRYQEMKVALEEANTHLYSNPNKVIESLRDAHRTKAKELSQRFDTAQVSAEEAAEILAREKLPVSHGNVAIQAEELGRMTLKGKNYNLKLTSEGEFRLFDEAGNKVLTSAERANLPQVIPARHFDDADLTIDSIARQPKETTVAYGTGSTTGDWIEVTKLADDNYRIVKVKNGAIDGAPLDDVSNLRIVEEGGRHKLTWDHPTSAGEYGNISEVYKGAPLKTPAISTTPTAVATPTVTSPAASTSAPVTPAASPATPSAIPTQITNLEQQVAQIEQRVATKADDVSRLETELATAERTQGRVGTLERKISDARLQADELERSLQAVRDDLASPTAAPLQNLPSGRLARKINSLKDKITKAEEARVALKAERKNIKEALKRRKTVLEELKDAREALNNATGILRMGERSTLRSTIRSLRKELKQIGKTVKGETLSSIDSKITYEKTRKIQFERDLATAKQKLITELEKQVQRRQTDIAKYEAQIQASGPAPSTGGRTVSQINEDLARARQEAADLNAELSARNMELADLTGTSAPATAPAGTSAAPAAAPSAARQATAERTAEALQRRKEAVQTYRTSREKIVALEDQMAPIELRLEAMEGRGAPQIQIDALKRRLKQLDADKKSHIAIAETAADEIWATRKDYWKSQVENAGTAVRERIGIRRKVEWIKSKSEFVGKVVEAGGKALKVPAKYLWEALNKQVEITSTSGLRLQLFGRTGAEITHRMEVLRAAALPGSTIATDVLRHLAMDQYDILKEVEGDGTQKMGLPSREAFAAMSPEDQIKALGGGYAKLEGLATGEPEKFYTESEQNYIKDKENTFRETLAEVTSQGEFDEESVQEALDEAFGPQGLNDSQKAYEVSIEGITMKVDAKGNRTYEGVEKWVETAPTRKTIRGLLAEKSEAYGEMSPAGLKREAGDKAIKSAQEFQKHAEEEIRDSLIAKYKETGEYPKAGTYESIEKTESGEPKYKVDVDDDGKIEVSMNQAWAKETYDGIKSRPEPEPETPAPAPATNKVAARPAPRPKSKTEQPQPTEQKEEPYDPNAPYV